MIGILAYGSLISNPGREIKEITDRTIVEVKTPFAVEYARKSRTRADSPTLVPVANEKGISVKANIFVLNTDVQIDAAKDILYRREMHEVGNFEKKYPQSNNPNIDKVIIEEITSISGVDIVLSTRIGTNIPEILDENHTAQEKAGLLANLAIKSVTKNTFFNNNDGIRYLDTAIQDGVITRLTELYKQVLLNLTDNSPDLNEARLWVAKQNNLIS